MPITETPDRVAAVVVTYNRCSLLRQCIGLLRAQTSVPDLIIVVDNASTDGTSAFLEGLPNTADFHVLRLGENLGGAGGFEAGIREAMARKMAWAWIMDDDAEPEPLALEHLRRAADSPENIYGSIAINGEYTAWLTTIVGPNRRVVDLAADVPTLAEVQSLPFLGFMIHRNLVERIGTPEAGYFIAADDIEYCLRARKAGAKIFVAGRSRITHPKSERYHVFGTKMIGLRLPPWKRYYDTRNRLLIAKRYYGKRWVTQTIPGSFLRLAGTLANEPRKLAQTWAFIAGFVDGVLGFTGRRHEVWRIPF